jgi:hypothetical protein
VTLWCQAKRKASVRTESHPTKTLPNKFGGSVEISWVDCLVMDASPIPQAADPCAIVIFGASGDLTKRKLLPSLYNLGSGTLGPEAALQLIQRDHHHWFSSDRL